MLFIYKSLVVSFGKKGLFLSHGELGKFLHIDRRSAVRVIQRLQHNGHVEITRQDGRRFVRASADILSLVSDDSLSTGVVTGESLALVTGESPPSKGKVKGKSKRTFTPPTIEEVKGYVESIGHPEFDAEYFVGYYEDRHWIKKNGEPVESWKLTVRSWIRNNRNSTPAKPQRKPQRGDFDWAPTEEELEAIDRKGDFQEVAV